MTNGGARTNDVDVVSGSTLSIGTTASARTINIGNGTSSTAVSVSCGTGTCGFGNNGTTHTTTVGSNTSTSATTIQSGSGGISLSGAVTGSSTINAVTGFRFNGTSGSTTTCTGGNVLSNPVVQGGIITGGSCVANGGGSGISGSGVSGYVPYFNGTNSLTGEAGFTYNDTTDTFAAANIQGNGSGLTSLNATNLSSGTVASGRISGSYTGITGVGTVTTGTWNGTTVGAAYGGTGQSSYTVGDLLYASGTTALSKLAAVASGSCLISQGTGTAPVWGSCTSGGGIGGSGTSGQVTYFNGSNSVTSEAGFTYNAGTDTLAAVNLQGAGSSITALNAGNISSGTLSVARGGTGAGTFTQYGVLYGNGTGAFQVTAVGTTGQCLVGNTGAAPSWTSCSGAGGGVTTVGAIDGGTYSANGASIASQTIYLQSASATQVGLVTLGSQAFAGAKTFNDNVTIGNATSDRLTVTAQLSGGSPLVFQGATDNSFTTTLALTDPTANRTITLPNDSGDVCLSSGNCSGVGGSIAGSGTSGQVTYFNGSNSVTSEAGFTYNAGTDTLAAVNLQGAGSSITALNAGNISSGTLSVARGGTGAGTFTQYGVLYGNGTGAFQVTAVGTTGQCLVGNTGAAPSWTSCSGAGGGATSVGTLDGGTYSANGGQIASGTLYLQAASNIHVGLVTIGAQTFAGAKTFSDAITVDNYATFKNASNSTTAFRVQNSASSNIFLVDTTNSRVGIATPTPTATLDVNGWIFGATGITTDTNVIADFNKNSDCTAGFQNSSCDAVRFGNGGKIGLASNYATTNIGGLDFYTNDAIRMSFTSSGDLTINGPTLHKNSSDSTTAFQVQNAAGTNILTVDTTNTRLIAGTTSNGVILSSNGIVLAGTARNSKKIVLNAEYPMAVLDPGTGSNNTGTMTSNYDMTNRMNYYKWTTTQTTSQSYDVVVQVPIPSDFDSWDTNPFTLTAYTTNTTDGTITVQVIKSNGSADTNFSSFQSATPGSTSTWATHTFSSLESSNYTAGDYMTLRIRMQAKSSGAVDTRVGKIVLSYKAKF